MTYRQSLALLAERQEARVRLGLSRIRRHLRFLGDPQESYPSLHVAGTNGKGSVCIYLDSILRESGLKVGLYLSPHLEDVRERIRVDGRWVSRGDFARLMERTVSQEGAEALTYFEILTSMAFQYFQEQGVDVAVLETGLGGRCDATNVIRKPLAAVIPSVDFDHMSFLGSRLSSIAREKAGIFKPGSPIFCGDIRPEAARVLKRRARALKAPIQFLSKRNRWRTEKIFWMKGCQIVRDRKGRRLRLGILGTAQADNAALVLSVLDSLRAKGFPLRQAVVSSGFAKARLPCRFETARRGSKTILLDGAHNAAAMRRFLATLEASPWVDVPKVFIVGFLKDKQYREMVRILSPGLRRVIATQPPNSRALGAQELCREIQKAAPDAVVTVEADPEAALSLALSNGMGERTACVCGSFYLAGLARRILKG